MQLSSLAELLLSWGTHAVGLQAQQRLMGIASALVTRPLLPRAQLPVAGGGAGREQR